MTIVWDEPKRLGNLAKHGLDFADLDEGFFLSSMVVPAKEGRYMAIGRLANGVIAVVFAVLGAEGLSVISGQPQGKESSMIDHRNSDAEEARIQAMIASDPDAPEATDDQLAQARPFSEALPALAEALRRGGRPRSESPKQAVSIRLDQDVIARFKAGGPGWQSRMNDALRQAAGL